MKVDKSGGPDACWNWIAALNSGGYGRIRLEVPRGARGHVFAGAHRVAWELTNGPVPAGLEIRHKCDNRRCVNLSHMELGTRSDNVNDMYRRGRQGNRGVRGERNPRAGISDEVARAIVEDLRNATNKAAVARKHGVTAATVYQIASGSSWRHLTSEALPVPPVSSPVT
jgi:hypothetical protein